MTRLLIVLTVVGLGLTLMFALSGCVGFQVAADLARCQAAAATHSGKCD